jgi:molybdate transport repressor ModE-like protein
MAYSKARRVIGCCERSLGFPLTLRKTGGASGGGSEVTAEAADLVRMYEALRTEIQGAIGEAYKKHFGEVVEVTFHKTVTQKRGPKKDAEETSD